MKTMVITVEKTMYAEALVEVPDDWTGRDLMDNDLKNYFGLDWETDEVRVVDSRHANDEDDCLPSLEYVI